MDIMNVLNEFFTSPWVVYFWVVCALIVIIVFHDPIKLVIDFFLKGIKFIIQLIVKFFKWIKSKFSKKKNKK